MDDGAFIVVGNSDGIGLGLTRALLGRGARVAGISRSASPVSHERYRHLVCDVTAAEFPLVLRDCVANLGAVAGAVYCAGIGERTRPDALALDLRVFEVNLIGAIRMAEVLLPEMIRVGRGRILVLSSQADRIVSHEASSYTASKAALSSYFEGLGLKLRNAPVQICNVRFGFVATKMARAGAQPFRMSIDRAVRHLLHLLDGERCPLRATYPRRMAILVAVIACFQRIRVALCRR